MSVAPLAHAQAVPLPELVDGIALRTGAWVVVERFGTVLTHGAGGASCPPAVTAALLADLKHDYQTPQLFDQGHGLRRCFDIQGENDAIFCLFCGLYGTHGFSLQIFWQQALDNHDIAPNSVKLTVFLVNSDFSKAKRSNEIKAVLVLWKNEGRQLPEP